MAVLASLLSVFFQANWGSAEPAKNLVSSVIEGSGTVKHFDLDGKFWGIEMDDGEKLSPHDTLPEALRQDGLRVHVKAKEIKVGGCFHMWGTLVEILSIEKDGLQESVKQLGSPEWTVRQKARQALLARGQGDPEGLLAALPEKDPDPEIAHQIETLRHEIEEIFLLHKSLRVAGENLEFQGLARAMCAHPCRETVSAFFEKAGLSLTMLVDTSGEEYAIWKKEVQGKIKKLSQNS